MGKGSLPASKSRVYFPQLDAIRGVSFIAIFLYHTLKIADSPSFPGGFAHYVYQQLDLGIEVFFVLSAFLLTWLGLNEYQQRANFSLTNYFKRRTLRIWPLYFFILLLAFLVFPPVAAHFHFVMTLPDGWYYIFFVANFYTIDHIFFLRFLWTISVEEQFYFLWGLCLRFLHKKLLWIALVLMVASMTFSVYAITCRISSYFNSLTYLFDFGCGGLAAVLMYNGSRVTGWLKRCSKGSTLIFYSYLIFHLLFFYGLNRQVTGTGGELVSLVSRYLIILYTALLLSEQMLNPSRTRFFEKNAFLKFTGKISYGLYCYHGITITFVNLILSGHHLHNGVLVVIYFALNYGIATMSYFYLESPFLKLKSRLRRIQ